MAKASRKQALESINKKRDSMIVEEWGGEVLLKRLTLRDRMEVATIGQKMQKGDNKIDKDIAKIVISCVLDPETEEQFFSNGDVEILSRDDTTAVWNVYLKLLEISGFGIEIQEEIEKN